MAIEHFISRSDMKGLRINLYVNGLVDKSRMISLRKWQCVNIYSKWIQQRLIKYSTSIDKQHPLRPYHEFLREKVYEMHLYILHKSKVSRQLGPKTTSKYITATNLTENY